MANKTYDFSGWATRNDLLCSDGRTIRKDAFKDCDGMTVPLVWNHQHNDPSNVLGHALLENRDDGVYTYCSFNDSPNGKTAREMVSHGDIKSLSIYANHLKQSGTNVLHGAIREVSLVLAGANPGAFIDSVMVHGEYSDEEAICFFGEENAELKLRHADAEPEVKEEATKVAPKEQPKQAAEDDETVADVWKTFSEKQKTVVYAIIGQALKGGKAAPVAHADTEDSDDDGETVADVFNTLTDKQKTVAYAIIGQAMEDAKKNGASDDDDEDDEDETNETKGETTMSHNVFEPQEADNDMDVISHSDMMAVIDDAKRYGSMKESALQHGITDITTLFPDDHNVNNVPGFINLYGGTWVNKVMDGVHHTPFSRLKSIYADISEDDARAKGYLADHTHRDAKGNLVDADGNPVKKKEEVFSLLKRTTSPTTVYKKQKLDRDDVVDITDFDVVSWIKGEMRAKLDEELARAFLIGDGRLASSDDKINESNIRPIWTDDTLYTINQVIEVASTATAEDKAEAMIDNAILGRVHYKGAGNPTLFTTETMLANMLLLKDVNGRRIYNNESDLATAMRVKEIVTVPYFEGMTRTVDSTTRTLGGIIVNLADYTVGADKGGAVNLFDDFDIDYNAQKYLIETRCSGSLLVPYSAIALEFVPKA